MSQFQTSYDFVVCGAGSAGSVVAGRLSENPDVSVLLIEAGHDESAQGVIDPRLWPTNLGSARDWGFRSAPNAHLHDRSLTFSTGKALGGGSAINAMIWARGHRGDWDSFAAEANDAAWGYDSVCEIYCRIEDYRGAPDPLYRGVGGPVHVEPAAALSSFALARLSAADECGIPTFGSPNGAMMEAPGGAAIYDLRIRNGKRESVFDSYVAPVRDRPNLTVLTEAFVTRIVISHDRAVGVEVAVGGETMVVAAEREVVVSLGTIQTPKVLMLSGIGDDTELRRVGLPVHQHLPGVGGNFQDHVLLSSVWEAAEPHEPSNNLGATTVYWSALTSQIPDIFICEAEVPMSTDATAAQFRLPASGAWSVAGGLSHPKSRGRIQLTGPNPHDRLHIDANMLSDLEDLKTAVACVELCREIGNAPALRDFVKREAMPGQLKGAELEGFIRDAATTYWHPCGTAKMGHDACSVVDNSLKVYGVDNLRIADASILPHLTTGNTMAACVVIGERAAAMISAEHSL